MNESKKKSLISVRKAITSLKKIESMIENDEYC
jgi:DNA-binding FrmR family transcriptional regulator